MAQNDIVWTVTEAEKESFVAGYIDLPNVAVMTVRVNCGFVPSRVRFFGASRIDGTQIIGKWELHRGFRQAGNSADVYRSETLVSNLSGDAQILTLNEVIATSALTSGGLIKDWGIDLANGHNGGAGFEFAASTFGYGYRYVYFIADR